MPDKQYTNNKHLHSFRIAMQMKTPSQDTVNGYCFYVKYFLDNFKNNPQRATTVELTEFIVSKYNTRSSMARARAAIKLLYELVFKQPNKVEFIPYPKQDERIKDIPTHEQMLRLIELTQNTKHKLILTMLYGTGMRCAELRGVRWCDIRREVGENPLSVKVHGKGAKDRYLPLSEKINTLLKEYCKEYKLGCETNKKHFVFGNKYGAPYSAKSVANIVEAAGKRIGIQLTPHMIRHATMEQLSKNGMQLLDIQDICGHQSAKTTRIYTKANNVNKKMPV